MSNHAHEDAGGGHVGPPKRTSTAYSEARKREMKIFAQRLWRNMIRKGWNQAEFSRQTRLHDTREGAPGIGRDMIGGYIRALHLPEPPHVRILAATLGVEPEDLLPTIAEVAEHDSSTAANLAPPPPLEMRTTSDGKVMLHVNLELPLSVAAEVIVLIQRATAGGGA